MKKNLVLSMVLFAVAAVGLSACTDNASTRMYGGTSRVDLPVGRKLVNITWKEADIWYLTRPMEEGDTATSYEFKESSNYGMMEGTIVITEHASK